jgi:predicted nucleic acid-binding protein
LILVDTSVWVDHLRRGDAALVDLLERSAVVMHPFVVGEIACGSLRDRESILELLQDLPAAVVASPDEVLTFVESQILYGKGIGYVDVHLLTSVALTPGARLWTRDTKLRRAADSLGCAHPESAH